MKPRQGFLALFCLTVCVLWVTSVLGENRDNAGLGYGHDSKPLQTQTQDLEFTGGIVWYPDLPHGYLLIEGDIQVRKEEFEARVARLKSTYGAVTFWPNGLVPFVFSNNVTQANQQLMVNAMAAISARTGVVFRQFQPGDANWIFIQDSAFNNSPVGMQRGQQTINIASWRWQMIMVHELYHSLGFWHEQSRSDRNAFVTINNANICGSSSSQACTPAACCLCQDQAGNCVPCVFNFDIVPAALTYGPYDFDSVMHYRDTAFTCNGLDTITVNPPWNAQWQNAIGQLDHFSHLDAVTCRGIYPVNGDRWLDINYAGQQLGTFSRPWNTPFATAEAATPINGTLFVNPGNYSAPGLYSRPITIEAPIGGVVLGP